MPTEPGFYWASSGTFGWYNLIVRVEGQAPMLYIPWVVNTGLLTEVGVAIQKAIPSDIKNWGPKIETPELK